MKKKDDNYSNEENSKVIFWVKELIYKTETERTGTVFKLLSTCTSPVMIVRDTRKARSTKNGQSPKRENNQKPANTLPYPASHCAVFVLTLALFLVLGRFSFFSYLNFDRRSLFSYLSVSLHQNRCRTRTSKYHVWLSSLPNLWQSSSDWYCWRIFTIVRNAKAEIILSKQQQRTCIRWREWICGFHWPVKNEDKHPPALRERSMNRKFFHLRMITPTAGFGYMATHATL